VIQTPTSMRLEGSSSTPLEALVSRRSVSTISLLSFSSRRIVDELILEALNRSLLLLVGIRH
jgi:hypothetical protein